MKQWKSLKDNANQFFICYLLSTGSLIRSKGCIELLKGSGVAYNPKMQKHLQILLKSIKKTKRLRAICRIHYQHLRRSSVISANVGLVSFRMKTKTNLSVKNRRFNNYSLRSNNFRKSYWNVYIKGLVS